jgi:hypothetical protein
MLKRLAEFASAKYKQASLMNWATRQGLLGFLTRRCSKDFLELYLASNPDIFTKVSTPGLFLNSVPEVDLAVRLRELGLLPEIHRKIDRASLGDGHGLDVGQRVAAVHRRLAHAEQVQVGTVEDIDGLCHAVGGVQKQIKSEYGATGRLKTGTIAAAM